MVQSSFFRDTTACKLIDVSHMRVIGILQRLRLRYGPIILWCFTETALEL